MSFLRVEPGIVAVVELDRGDNSFINAEVVKELADTLEDLAAGQTRAVVLASRGKHFCAGADLAGGWRPDVGEEAHIYDQAVRVFAQPLPMIAAVHGAAIGAGVGLALAADFRVTSPESRFAVSFVKLGFHPGFGTSVTLPRLLGPQVASDLILTGRRINGTTAHEIGLCDRIVAQDAIRSEAIAWATEIAGTAPIAARSARATLRADLVSAVRAGVRHERAEQEIHMRTADFTEGVRASGERREPEFNGQ